MLASILKAEINTHPEFFRLLVGLARQRTSPKPYPDIVADFVEATVDCLSEGRDFDTLKTPLGEPSLLSSMMQRLSTEGPGTEERRCNPILVDLATELYGCGEPSAERANWLLIQLLGIWPDNPYYFEPLRVRDRRGWTQNFFVSTPRFEQEFNYRVRVPISFTSVAHREVMELDVD